MSGFATSDEDELSVLPVATPARSYTRSESDDDDEDDAPPRDATRRSRSYQASDKRSLHPRHLADPLDHLTPRKSIETTGYSNRRLVTRRRSHHVTKRRSSSESFSESAQLAKIEVALPWLPREYRAAFRYVRVPPSDGLEEEDFDSLPPDDDQLAQGARRGVKRKQDDDEEYSDTHWNDYDHPLLDRSTRNQPSSTPSEPRSRGGHNLREVGMGSEPPAGRVLRTRPAKAGSTRRPGRQSAYGDDEPDELMVDIDDSSDEAFSIVQSDLVGPAKKRKTRRRPRLQIRDSSIEFEARRSSRANKNTKSMNYSMLDDDDYFEFQEEIPAGPPKVAGVREVFMQPEAGDFIAFHRPVCEVCNGNGKSNSKGPLIPCQGCSYSYHKLCLGQRTTREHCVTKVDGDSFVLQCRFCVGTSKKLGRPRTYGVPRDPFWDDCQSCHDKGPACAAFSTKKTPKQEEKLRAENDGVDPVTRVAAELLNNPDNVLFRCSRCRRGFHYDHLPHPTRADDPAKDDAANIRKHRLDEYSINWTCQECTRVDGQKVNTLVAWRPADGGDRISTSRDIGDFSEDQIEYLVRWENQSYRHCDWMPGAWVHGFTATAMRQAFLRRNDSEFADEEDESAKNRCLKYSTEEAIPEAYITPDVILDIHMAPRSGAQEAKYKQMSPAEKKESDLSRIHHVAKMYVKFEGLGYEDTVWDTPPSPDNEVIWRAFYGAYQEYLNGKHFESEPARDIQDRIQAFRKLDFNTDIKTAVQPAGLRRGQLMDYQLEGLNWLLWNYRIDRSVILADEMGLGKTVQVVALLASLVQVKPNVWPFLVVVPNPTCPNWRREIKKWAPDLRVVAYYGGKLSMDLAYQHELFPKGGRDMKAHVVIMSYDSAQDDRTKGLFSSVKWAGLIVDEAQRLKNDQNILYKSLKAMNIKWNLLLTGTPLQNNKRELFNLLQFIAPAEINAAALDEEFSELNKERVEQLHNIIRPYFLRRTKAQVLTFLPPMAQIIVPVSMTVLQEKLCKSIMEKNPQLIRSIFARGKLKATEKTGLNNILMQLRKCLCHPFIYSKAIEDQSTAAETMRRNLVEASAKLLLLETMLPLLKERGHRVLIFSQFLEQLTILEDFFNGLALKYQRLDGSLSSIEKQKRIDAFNAPDSELFCMLLSTRAGGVGINLATADTVIILDPDFNPHQDIQALSRAHRIGQKKKVLCFQLMTQDSPEEKIIQIGRKKMVLDHVLIESMDENQAENTTDMESILKHGAAALFSEDKKRDVIVYDKAAVEKLLDRSATEETTNQDDKSAESAFAFAKVWANDEGSLTEDVKTTEHTVNVGVWDDILKEREEEARREALKNLEVLGRGGRRRQATSYTGPKYGFEDNQDELVDEEDAEQKESDADEFKGGEGEQSESESDAAEELSPNSRALTDLEESQAAKVPSQVPTASRASVPGPVSRPSVPRGPVPKASVPTPGKPVGAPNISANPVPELIAIDTPKTNRRPRGRPPNPRNVGALPLQRQNSGPGRVATVPSNAVGPGPRHDNQMRQPGGVLERQVPGGSASNPMDVDAPPSVGPATLAPNQGDHLCFVCGYLHPILWQCPEMSSIIKLRIAMDALKYITDISPMQLAARRQFLLTRIRDLHAQASLQPPNVGGPFSS